MTVSLSPHEAAALALLQARGQLSRRDLAAHLGVSRKEAEQVLRALTQQGHARHLHLWVARTPDDVQR